MARRWESKNIGCPILAPFSGARVGEHERQPAALNNLRHPPAKLGCRVGLAKECFGNGHHAGSASQHGGGRGQRYSCHSHQHRAGASLLSQLPHPFHANRSIRCLLGPGRKNRADGKIVCGSFPEFPEPAWHRRQMCPQSASAPAAAVPRGCRVAGVHMHAIEADLLHQINPGRRGSASPGPQAARRAERRHRPATPHRAGLPPQRRRPVVGTPSCCDTPAASRRPRPASRQPAQKLGAAGGGMMDASMMG